LRSQSKDYLHYRIHTKGQYLLSPLPKSFASIAKLSTTNLDKCDAPTTIKRERGTNKVSGRGFIFSWNYAPKLISTSWSLRFTDLFFLLLFLQGSADVEYIFQEGFSQTRLLRITRLICALTTILAWPTVPNLLYPEFQPDAGWYNFVKRLNDLRPKPIVTSLQTSYQRRWQIKLERDRVMEAVRDDGVGSISLSWLDPPTSNLQVVSYRWRFLRSGRFPLFGVSNCPKLKPHFVMLRFFSRENCGNSISLRLFNVREWLSGRVTW
jgi:hypothetical protein